MFEYLEKMKELVENLNSKNKEKLEEVSDLIFETIKNDTLIHILGTGHSHMIGLEMFIRAGGLANINTILDSTVLTADGAIRSSKLEKVSGIADILWEEQVISKKDLVIVISNSGRNTLPIEFAKRAKENENKVIVITSLEQSTKYPSRDNSGTKLFNYGDIVIDNLAPSGDGNINLGGVLVGGVSSISGMLILHTAITEAMKKAFNLGIKLPVYTSQNIDGFDNNALYEKYRGRIKHM